MSEVSRENIRVDQVTPKNTGISHPEFRKSLLWLGAFAVINYGVVVIISVLSVLYYSSVKPELLDDDILLQAVIFESMSSPDGMTIMYFIHSILLVPAILYASNFQKQNWRATLGFNGVPWRTLGHWVAMFSGYIFIQVVFFGQSSGDSSPLSSLAGSKHFGVAFSFIVLAPIIEELIFRGYLFKAWRNTRLGLWGTIFLTSVIFTSLHIGLYQGFSLVFMFVLSVILGLAREKTGSIWVPLLLHGINNFLAVVSLIYLGIL